MAPFRTFWELFEAPSLLSKLDDQLAPESELRLSLGCLRHLVLESDATHEQMQQLIFPYLEPLFELYTATQSWTTTGMADLFVEDLLLKYFSCFPDSRTAGKGLAGLLSSRVAVGPCPIEFRPGLAGFCLSKRCVK